jgi:hypothetical protein
VRECESKRTGSERIVSAIERKIESVKLRKCEAEKYGGKTEKIIAKVKANAITEK